MKDALARKVEVSIGSLTDSISTPFACFECFLRVPRQLHRTLVMARTVNFLLSFHISANVLRDPSRSCSLCAACAIESLTALALAVAPELASAEMFEDIEFETICNDFAAQVNPPRPRSLGNAAVDLSEGF